ncbi:NIF family HAD-type phosphatase [Neptuniibacter sp. QD48_11]|uniref:NIF family HAD-type phosphatase n=1 Tax=Neptuniibacter sp. QD48_11 TaxID=3398211 RepID=UPI0039F48E6D
MPTVCLGLNGTLFWKLGLSDATALPEDWLKNAVSVESNEGCHIVIPRPGAAELLVELERHACPMIYSAQNEEFIEKALLQLSIAQGDPDTCTDEEYEKSEAFYDHYVWSRDQCIAGPEGFRKSLGTLSEFSDNSINDIWLIDHSPERVDFPNHVIGVAEFTGDPQDRELFKVIDQIFVN